MSATIGANYTPKRAPKGPYQTRPEKYTADMAHTRRRVPAKGGEPVGVNILPKEARVKERRLPEVHLQGNVTKDGTVPIYHQGNFTTRMLCRYMKQSQRLL